MDPRPPAWMLVEELAFYEDYYACRLTRTEALQAVADQLKVSPDEVARAADAFETANRP